MVLNRKIFCTFRHQTNLLNETILHLNGGLNFSSQLSKYDFVSYIQSKTQKRDIKR